MLLYHRRPLALFVFTITRAVSQRTNGGVAALCIVITTTTDADNMEHHGSQLALIPGERQRDVIRDTTEEG